MTTRAAARAPLLAAAMLSMLLAVWLGLVRLGWPLPVPVDPFLHATLLFGGFFGTLISLERAVALKAGWAYAAPVLSAAGAALAVAEAPRASMAAVTLASGVLTAAGVVIALRQPALFSATMAAGAGAWLAGNALWLGGAAVFQVVYWWVGFVTLTIAGERLELNRLLRPTRAARRGFMGAAGLLAAGLALTAADPQRGVPVTGAALGGLAAWLLRYDLARRTVRGSGLTRYMAVALLAGYVWLGAAGIMAVAFGFQVAGPRYDAVLHAALLGFVMSMVFAHAPVIFPAVLGTPLPYRPWFYVHLALLHGSLAVRIAGDLVPALSPLRRWGGLLNAAAMILFVVATVGSAALGPPRSAPQ